MPDLYRATLIMTGRGQGWSESYVIPRDQANVAQVMGQQVAPMAQARARLLAREYTLQAMRVTKIRLADGTRVKRNSDLSIVNLPPGGTTAGWSGCQPNECVIANGVTLDAAREKKVFMRGIPDQIIEDGGTLNHGETIGWFSRLDSFFATLLVSQCGWLGDTAQGEPSNVSNYVVGDGFQVTVTFAGPIFVAVPAQTRIMVRLSRINGKSELNGIQQMIVLTPTTAITVEAFSVFPYSHGGSGQIMTSPKPFFSAAAWGAELARTHQTGKVSVGTRGRASARPKG